MIVKSKDVALQIVAEYNRRLKDVEFPEGTGFLIESFQIEKLKADKFEIFMTASDGVNELNHISLQSFIKDTGHNFDYGKFGLDENMIN